MGNFSRDTFDLLKHYVNVRLQQGVPLVDADWNEQDDIRKYELQAFIKWFIGNGVPPGNNGFLTTDTGDGDDLLIKGGDGTPEGAGRCLVDGWDVIIEADMRYTEQPLFGDAALATTWGVDALPALTIPNPGNSRSDTVYLDIWEREVDSVEDTDLINPAIGVETAVRLKREWVVRVAEGQVAPPAAPADHVFYSLSTVEREAIDAITTDSTFTDRRDTGLSLSSLLNEVEAARGDTFSLDSRLSPSLTDAGQLQNNVVADAQVSAGAAIQESKVLFSGSGHDHGGGAQGQIIDTNGLADDSVTSPKIKFEVVNSGSIADLDPGDTQLVLVEADITFSKQKIYLPTISLLAVTGTGLAQITAELVYRALNTDTNYDVYLEVSNRTGGSEQADVSWTVYTFAEE